MSLQPIAIDLCQTSALRGRRRSSIRPQNLLPLLFTSGVTPPNQNESAVADEAYLPEHLATDASSASPTLISPISDAHMSGHSSSFSTKRHHDALSTPKSVIPVSPSDSAVSDDFYCERRSTSNQDPRLKWRLASAFFIYFLNGWGDGVTGTALPYFRAEFHLTYMTSSLLFVGTTCGFTSGTLLVPRIINFLGRFYLSDAKLPLLPTVPFRIALSRNSLSGVGQSPSQARYLALILAGLGPPINYIMMGSKSGFPTMFMAYVVVAFAKAVITAPLNIFLSNMPNRPLGYAFGLWGEGLGAVASPLVFQATAAAGLPWAHFYFGSLVNPPSYQQEHHLYPAQVLAAINFGFLGITFMPTAREFALDRKNALDEAKSHSRPDADHASTPDPIAQLIPELRLVSSMPYQWAVSLFVLFYCGSETTTQGLIVQYLLAERNANPNTVGYVTSGFWAGASASRLAWSYFSPRVSFTGRKYIIQGCLVLIFPQRYAHSHPWIQFPYALLALALCMQLFIWFIDSNIENAVSTALIGVFYGPLFPACLELANDLLPIEVNMISMAIVSASGSVGSAIFPFVTGVVTTKYSMRCWSYITVAQVAILFGAWYLFPTRQPLRRPIAA
ncbi:MFS general substrate transporter [Mycena vulgaris]|nr:MFS general substrate transporter [Mycena vulgaris]